MSCLFDLRVAQGCALLLFFALLAGCSKSESQLAAESDANGYLCQKCEAKLYTERSAFLGPKCPKCNEDSLVEVVGYVCPKDKHVTIRARTNDRLGAPVCDQCKGEPGGMCLPRETDLKTWGAVKVSS